uniref:Enoyl reductase (ER) domain-containing protein n=1 Tax=Kalanchoe fedtschenkoi TaxID=63787 RepID=A0A7N0TMR7_KALFE
MDTVSPPLKVEKAAAFGWAARDPSGILSPFHFSVRATGESDVKIKILYCGVCHTDLHFIRNDWGGSSYPLVPGHEIAGIVTEVGAKARKFQPGDKVGVGCLVGSCGACPSCEASEENYCPKLIRTYNDTFPDGARTYGGYADTIVVDEHFAVRFPENMPLDAGAPLLCAGISVYSPLSYYGLDKAGLRVGVVGLGGLGHVAVKFAKAMGLKVTVISTSVGKKVEAVDRLGADGFILSTNEEQIQAAVGTLDGIIDTVSAMHSVEQLLRLLKARGKLVLVGLPEAPLQVNASSLVEGRKSLVGSLVGGMRETQEMLTSQQSTASQLISS